jgi:hypothetical protein
MSGAHLRDLKKPCGACEGTGTLRLEEGSEACGTCQGAGTIPWTKWAQDRLFDILWNADASQQAFDETAREIVALLEEEPPAGTSAPEDTVRALCGLLTECRTRLPRVKRYIIDHKANDLRSAPDTLDDRIGDALRRAGY